MIPKPSVVEVLNISGYKNSNSGSVKLTRIKKLIKNTIFVSCHKNNHEKHAKFFEKLKDVSGH